MNDFSHLRLVDKERREYEFVNAVEGAAEKLNLDSIKLTRIYNILSLVFLVVKEKRYPLSKKEWVKTNIAKYPEFAMVSQGFRKDFAYFWQIISNFFADKITGPTPFDMIEKYKITAQVLYKDPVLMQKNVIVNFASGKRFIKNRLTPNEVKKIQQVTRLNNPNRDTMSYLLWCVQKTQK